MIYIVILQSIAIIYLMYRINVINRVLNGALDIINEVCNKVDETAINLNEIRNYIIKALELLKR